MIFARVRRGAIASIDLTSLTELPERLADPDRCETARCRGRDALWNPVLRVWQCHACRTMWADKETQITYRNDLTEPSDMLD